MSWTISRFRAGDWVEVRSKDEILASLDKSGCVEGMPFMPEMLKYCGQRLRVRAVAHKTCDTARQTWKNRRLANTVHLAGLRCDGLSHGGCQAECALFWKDVWLKSEMESASRVGPTGRLQGAHCTESQLHTATYLPILSPDDPPCYSCQATMLFDATEPFPWWDLRQYYYDVVTGNHTIRRVLRVTWLGLVRWLPPRVPFGYRLLKSFSDWMHQILTGRAEPSMSGEVKRGESTPTGRLDLKPGEYVRIKSQKEIEQTIDDSGKNRGLGFDPEEMAPFCGKVYRVRKSVTHIIDEMTGKMRSMKHPCIMLEGVVCMGEYAGCRLNCAREIPSYWREIWLERVNVEDVAASTVPIEGREEVCEPT